VENEGGVIIVDSSTSDNREGDAEGDQSIFDGGGLGSVLQEARKKLARSLAARNCDPVKWIAQKLEKNPPERRRRRVRPETILAC